MKEESIDQLIKRNFENRCEQIDLEVQDLKDSVSNIENMLN